MQEWGLDNFAFSSFALTKLSYDGGYHFSEMLEVDLANPNPEPFPDGSALRTLAKAVKIQEFGDFQAPLRRYAAPGLAMNGGVFQPVWGMHMANTEAGLAAALGAARGTLNMARCPVQRPVDVADRRGCVELSACLMAYPEIFWCALQCMGLVMWAKFFFLNILNHLSPVHYLRELEAM